MSVETDLITISDKVTKIANYVENLTTLFMEDNATNADWILLKADLQDYASNIDNVKSGILTVANGGTGQTSIAEIQAGKDGNGNTITTTYATKTELSNLSKGLIQVVSELPTTGSEGIIYLVKSASDSDTFDKYTWENNAFLNLGTTVIDLTSYVQKANAISDLSINGKVITYIKADGSTGTLTTQDTNTTYNVVSTTANGLMSKDDKSKLDGIAAGAQVNTVTGVKGNSESAYRTGNINITAANVGAATSSHAHGNINNTGAIGTTANLPIITGTDGKLQAGSFGTAANTFCQGNDSRLSDSRTPKAHTHSADNINSGTLSTDRIPDLAASKITSGTFNAARIPNLDASKITSGTIDIARLPAAALERLVTVTDATARKKLTTSNVQVGDTVKETSTGRMYRVVDDTKLTSDDGYIEYTVGSAASVPWSGVTGKPSSYYTHPSATAYNSGLYKITVNNLGHVTAATAVTKTDITDLGIPSTNTTYSAASQSANGLMSAADKKKLDGIASGANNYTYTLPTASSTLGGVKTTSTVTSTSGLTACPIIDGIPYYKDTNTTYSLSSLGIGNVKNYDQSKAIKAITRNGTTFTYTCLDGTTGTFTQQDNNTTYSNFVKSGNGAAAGLVPSPGTTAGTTKYLREDGTWQVPPNTNTWTAFKGCSSSAAGTAGYIPAPAAGDQTKFFRADGTWVVPTNTTYSNMTAATASAAGKAGLVPAPAAGKQASFLRGDGTWVVPTNTTYTVTTSGNGNAVTAVSLSGSTITATKGATFLTSHQSLAGYLPLTTNVSELGRYIDMHYDNATKKYDYDARIYVDSQGNAAGKGVLKVTADSVELPTTFISNEINVKNTAIVQGTATSSNCYAGFNFRNSTNDTIGQILYYQNSGATGTSGISLRISRNVNSKNTDNAAISIVKAADGSFSTAAPTPADNDNTTKIATTAWVQKFCGTTKKYLTSHQSLTNYSTLANTVKSISISGKTITVTPGSGTAYTLTTQDTTYSNFVKSGSGAKAGLVPAPSTTAGTTKYLREDGTWQVPPNTNTWTAMIGATSSANGTAGYVPAPPKSGYNTKYLRADGTWQVPPDTNYFTLSDSVLHTPVNTGLSTYGTLRVTRSDYNKDTTTNSDLWWTQAMKGANDVTIGGVWYGITKGTGKDVKSYYSIRAYNHQSSRTDYALFTVCNTGSTVADNYISVGHMGSIQPIAAGISLGANTTANKWKEIWCAQSSLNSTSDSRLKNSIISIDDNLLDAWSNVEWVQFKYNDATKEKGDKARLHTGLIAQQVQEVCTNNNLDITKYGLFCYDEWDAKAETLDEDGNVSEPAIEAGDCYSLRYVEALCVEAAYQRRRADRLEARLKALEDKLASM